MDAPLPELSHYLYPGGIFADPRPHRVTTVLGSCVSVCLWDRVRGVGGINHYLLPLWNGDGLPTPRYGNIAIAALIDRMLALKCSRENLRAKLFGGAAMWENPNGLLAVGERNIELARRQLAEAGIPVIASDLGGDAGRKIIFDTASGAVLLRRNRCQQAWPRHAGAPAADT